MWQTRRKDVAAYTAPSGERIVFDFEDVSTSHDKHTTAYEFPDVSGTYVQDLGRSGRRLPMRCILWGDNYDIEATKFESLLLEQGVGTLEHPLYGTFDVVPFGTITRTDPLQSASNQAVFDVTFFETTGAVYPSITTAPEELTDALLDEFNNAAATQFDFRAQLQQAVDAITFRNQIRNALTRVRKIMKAIADTVDTVGRAFTGIFDSINQGLDLLIGQPLTLAFQVEQLLQTPARSLSLISDKLEAYGNLVDDLIGQPLDRVGYDNRPQNLFLTLDFFAQAAVSGACTAAVSASYRSRSDAIAAADTVSAMLARVVTWREDSFNAMIDLGVGDEQGRVDTGEAYQSLQALVAATLGVLVSTSMTLPSERRITLTAGRNMLEFCAEVYGESFEGRLDEFIDLNRLTGDELFEIPVGRQVTYYVI